jgi:hypothetical protein
MEIVEAMAMMVNQAGFNNQSSPSNRGSQKQLQNCVGQYSDGNGLGRGRNCHLPFGTLCLEKYGSLGGVQPRQLWLFVLRDRPYPTL